MVKREWPKLRQIGGCLTLNPGKLGGNKLLGKVFPGTATSARTKKEAASHRYNRLPLLPSRPGGFSRSWSCRRRAKVRQNIFTAKVCPKINPIGIQPADSHIFNLRGKKYGDKPHRGLSETEIVWVSAVRLIQKSETVLGTLGLPKACRAGKVPQKGRNPIPKQAQ